MTDTITPPLQAPRRFRFDWVLPVLFRPRQAFARIAAANAAVWLTPMVILTVTALLYVWSSGYVRQSIPPEQAPLPPDYQYLTPDQQAQYQQAVAATSGPVFVYVFPAMMALGRVWLGWLMVGGLLHLALTLLGGRGDTGAAMNLVAWAALPLALRDLVRAAYTLLAHQIINTPSLAGFAPTDGSGLAVFLAAFLSQVDIFMLWHLFLLVLGVRAGNGLSLARAVTGVWVTLLMVLGLQALLGYFAGRLGSLTVTRPFF